MEISNTPHTQPHGSEGVLAPKKANNQLSVYIRDHRLTSGFRTQLEGRIADTSKDRHLEYRTARHMLAKAVAFLDWLEEKRGGPDPFSVLKEPAAAELINQYIEKKAPGISKGAVCQIRYALGQFLKWMKEEGLTEADPQKLEASTSRYSNYVQEHPLRKGFETHLAARVRGTGEAPLGAETAKLMLQRITTFLEWVEKKSGGDDPLADLKNAESVRLVLEYLEKKSGSGNRAVWRQQRSALMQFFRWMKSEGLGALEPSQLDAARCADHPILNAWRDTPEIAGSPTETNAAYFIRGMLRKAVGEDNYPGDAVREFALCNALMKSRGIGVDVSGSAILSALIKHPEFCVQGYLEELAGSPAHKDQSRARYYARQFFEWLSARLEGVSVPAGALKLSTAEQTASAVRAKKDKARLAKEAESHGSRRKKTAAKRLTESLPESQNPMLEWLKKTPLPLPEDAKKSAAGAFEQKVKTSPTRLISYRLDRILDALVCRCQPPLSLFEALNLKLWQVTKTKYRVSFVGKRQGNEASFTDEAGEDISRWLYDIAGVPSMRTAWEKDGLNASLLVNLQGKPFVSLADKPILANERLETIGRLNRCRDLLATLIMREGRVPFSKLVSANWPLLWIASPPSIMLSAGEPVMIPLEGEGKAQVLRDFNQCLLALGLVDESGRPLLAGRLPLLCDYRGVRLYSLD